MENSALIIGIVALWLMSIEVVYGQTPPLRSLGPEVQVYPAGVIFGIRADISLCSQVTGNLRLGYNLARRRDLGEHDDERGGGFGGSLGARYYFKEQFRGFFLGLRSDLWFMDIDWITERPGDEDITGTTDITVIQPLVEAGYTFVIKQGSWALTPKISLGYEINANTRGEEVGEGAISLLGISFSHRF